MSTAASIRSDLLRLDCAREAERICSRIREMVFGELKRKGAVIGVSGGIDSAVVAFLCARALDAKRILLLLLPEAESSSDSTTLGKMVAEAIQARSIVEDMTPLLKAAGCYQRRDDAVRCVIPEFGPGYKCKIALPNMSEGEHYALFQVVVRSPDGLTRSARLNAAASLGVVAATNFKQRARKMMEYYYADLLQYAVAGTPNRLEYDQGFFVKNGDGAADFKPIAHLYKSQVYQLAEHLGVPEVIRRRPPTTDTYGLEQSQEEFFFALPLETLDLCLYAKNHGFGVEQTASLTGMTEEQIRRVYGMIDSKRRMARYLHSEPLLVEQVARE